LKVILIYDKIPVRNLSLCIIQICRVNEKEKIMSKKKIIIITIINIIIILIVGIIILLVCNKTFLKNTYIGVQNQKIFIPKYSYFID